MKIWVIEIHYKNYDEGQIKSFEVYSMKEELCPVEFSDIEATRFVRADDDSSKIVSTINYFKTGNRLFHKLNFIIEAINHDKLSTSENIIQKLLAIREKISSQYPEYTL